MEPQWYNYLNNKDKKSLLCHQKINDEQVIICQQLEYRRYALFDDYNHFISYIEKTPESNRCFYEILLEDHKRKPYFDIDMDYDDIEDPEEIIHLLKEEIVKILPDAKFYVYSSHTNKKFSFHIVIDGYYFVNHNESKKFCFQIIDEIPESYRHFIDKSVYKSVQQFRILYSHKYEKNNRKVFRPDLSRGFEVPKRYQTTEKATYLYTIKSSFVSNTYNCKYLDGYQEIKKEFVSSPGFSSSGDLEDVIAVMHDKFGESTYSYLNHQEDNGNLLITFRRNYASYCPSCDRVHENENPFVVVKGLERNIYFYCRRNEKNKMLIGSLGVVIIPELNINDIPIIDKLEKSNDEEIPIQELRSLDVKRNKKYKPKVDISCMKF